MRCRAPAVLVSGLVGAALAAPASIQTEIVNVAVGAGTANSGVAMCEPGMRLLSGGFGGSGGLVPTLNFPELILDLWIVEMSSSYEAGSFRAAAVCTDQPVDIERQQDTALILANSPQTSVTGVLCLLRAQSRRRAETAAAPGR